MSLESLLLFSYQVVSDSFRPHGLQQSRLPCPSPSTRGCPSSCPLSRWCHPTIPSSVALFSFSLHWSFPVSWLFISGDWSFSISLSNEYSGLIFFKIDWFDHLAVQGALKSLCQHHSLKSSVLQCSVFFMVQLSHLYMTMGKTILYESLQRDVFMIIIIIIFNMLSRFVIAFLPRSNHLLISWLQSPSAVILELKKRKSVTASTFSPSICHEVMGLDVMILVFNI